MMKVAIIHPWFPQYRAAFFENLIRQTAKVGIELHIFYGSPPPEWGERGDSVSAPYATHLPTRFFKLGKKSLVFKSLKTFRRSGPYDLVIVEQAVRNIETYLLFLTKHRHKIAFWGHGRTYTELIGRRQEALKKWLSLRGAWFFAYTAGGAAAMVDAGFPSKEITIVQNSIDTKQLSISIDHVTTQEISSFNRQLDLRGKTALFMGGLDHAKRLPFLIEAAELCHKEDPDFRLIVLGDGSARRVIEEAAESKSWLKYLGRASGTLKAQALASSDLMMMPGRVGLVAVDSFAAGIPIITTDWPFHAPEYEYLSSGVNSLVTPDDISAYASQTLALLRDKDLLDSLSENARKTSRDYSVEQMATNFRTGLQAAVSLHKMST